MVAFGWILGALAVLASSLSPVAGTAELDAFIQAELPESAAPGLAYARVEDGEIVARGFGEQLEGSGDAVTADTLFPIGSVTKSFTALAIMQLVEADEINLDDPVSNYLPVFADGAGSKITLRQLLNHTSGFSTVQGNSQHGNADASQFDLIEYAGELAKAGPARTPGTAWEYSNANYQILGAVIERVSGSSYSDFVNARIFEPLGMASSLVAVGDFPASAATGHRPWFGSVRPAASGPQHRINAPAGGIISSANDMGRYVAMWLNGKEDVISAGAKAAMLAPSGPAAQSYGLGWALDSAQGTAYHTGLVPGFETLASFAPSKGTGVVVLVNANGGLGFADTWYLIGGVSARAMGQDHQDDGSRIGPQVAYLSIALLPPLFILFGFISWKGRSGLRRKRESSGGRISLWLPVLAMGGLAFFLLVYLPQMFGGSIATLRIYQPDFALCLIATAILAPAWAILRLVLAHSREAAAIDNG